MVELIIICEGQTEERFVTDVLAPALAPTAIYASARMIPTSPNSRGGSLNYDRVKRALRNTLLERVDTFVTTFFDLYALGSTFGGFADTRGRAPTERASAIERWLHEEIVAYAKCRPERFLPHVQPHEFEALLFSDVESLCQVEPEWASHTETLARVRDGVDDPEWINDSPHTAPSKRLNVLSPRYRKRQHGPVAAATIGLDKIREQCPHFRRWYERILGLRPI
ncbi:MAG TPA: DUF4276 family protein [Trinickia sp.]|jgi:hypothetical protein|uniref:DUF4276 family protein n=1 Tax=Trinickia sp. TaxID=2571163 RepID=UPI002C25EF00|nr:DUF4276 family protein [Trinickia sp.]HVW51648.1 DUF4276 family protein [Trinickia sp.]